MGEPVDLGRSCGLCGEQIELRVDTERGTWTDDLAALMAVKRGDRVVIEAHCACYHPRSVSLQGIEIDDVRDC